MALRYLAWCRTAFDARRRRSLASLRSQAAATAEAPVAAITAATQRMVLKLPLLTSTLGRARGAEVGLDSAPLPR